MPTLFNGINTALNAILAHQAAIEVIDHNVANADTKGYHRQAAVLKAGIASPSTNSSGSLYAGQIGSGVVVDRIRRFNMEFFDGRYRQEMAESKRWEAENQILNQLEITLAETSADGMVTKLDAFWSGWRKVSDDPSSIALRNDLKESAQSLVDGFNWRSEALNKLRIDQDLLIKQDVEEINNVASQVAKLNKEVAKIKGSGMAPNDLLDQRDLLLDRLSELAGAASNIQPDGQANVSINGHALVFASETFKLATRENSSGMAEIYWSDHYSTQTADTNDDAAAVMTPVRGELAGILDVRDNIIPDQLDSLNQLAFQLTSRVNAQHQLGSGTVPFVTDPPRGAYFFDPLTQNDPQNAGRIKLSADIDDPRNIAAASAANAPGDGSNAIKIADLSLEQYADLGSSTFNQYYTAVVDDLGLKISTASARADDRASVAASMEEMKESSVGVNLDEEAANLIKSQRAYQAAARILTTIDQMLDTVINGMGVGGR